MTKQHRATPEQWESIELYAGGSDAYSCFIELRARIEALEAAQQPHQDKMDRLIAIDRDDSTEDAAQQPNSSVSLTSSPADSLIDRVAKAIYDAPSGAHAGWRSEARAAILEVAAWLREKGYGSWVTLEQEANR